MQEETIQIFLVDDHHVFREGIRALFEWGTIIQVVGEAADGNEVIEKMKGKEVDVLLLDIDMPEVNGLDIIDTIIEEFPQVHILVFSMHDNEEYIRQMLSKGAKGYVLKSCRKEELFRAIRTVATGDTYLSEEVSKKIINYISTNKKHQENNTEVLLTNREIEVLKLVATGLTNLLIGAQLHISHRTVDTHRRNIMEKLNLHNAAALTNYAAKKGLLNLS